MIVGSASGKSMAELSSTIASFVAEIEPELHRMGRDIGADPEVAFDEHRAAARVASLLQENGFAVDLGAFGLSTAIRAVTGRGEVTVGIVAEYDALPGIGHGCGHNIIAAAAVGAAIALGRVTEELGIRVVLLGCPAEELGGGKIVMLDAGAWDDITFSLMVHPGSGAQPAAVGMTTAAFERVVVTFTGAEAHAAAAPHRGINAGDAVALAQAAIAFARQQIKPGTIVSSFVREAGHATNIIPARGILEIEVRAVDQEDWDSARKRVRACVRGAAIATGCEFEISHPEPPYDVLLQDELLATLWDEEISKLGYALDDESALVVGSTDMANVSRYLPAIHPVIALSDVVAELHTREYAVAARSEAALRAISDGALLMALTAARAVADTAVRDQLAESHRRRRLRVPARSGQAFT